MASVDVGSHPSGWLPSGVGDFNADATSDVLWYNAGNGDAEVWKLQNGQWAGSVDIGTHPAGYVISGTADFNNDGTSDVLWYNPTTRDTDIWLLNNGHWIASTTIGLHPAGYQIAGVGDFNHDGSADVLWFNPTTNDTDIWLLNNGHWTASTTIGLHPPGYQIAGIGDFNHDGTSDVLWFNPTTRDTDIWTLNNGHWAGSSTIGLHPAGYQIAGVGDFNQDGTSDVVWYNPTTNDVDVWLVQNGHWIGSVGLGSHPAGSVLAGVGDFDHNGVTDITWRDTGTGRIENWLLAYGGTNANPVIYVDPNAGDTLGGMAFDDVNHPAQQHLIGRLSFSDQEPQQTHSISDTVGVDPGPLGTLGTMFTSILRNTDGVIAGPGGDPDGFLAASQTAGVLKWDYQVNEDKIQWFGEGETYTDKFQFTLTDDHGGMTTQQVTVAIRGQNDLPTPGGDAQDLSLTFDFSHVKPTPGIVQTNAFTFIDPDRTDTHHVSVEFDPRSTVAASAGTLSVQLLGDTYAAGPSDTNGEVRWSYQYKAPPGGPGVQNWNIHIDDGHGSINIPFTVHFDF
jgi:hypothetical protein